MERAREGELKTGKNVRTSFTGYSCPECSLEEDTGKPYVD